MGLNILIYKVAFCVCWKVLAHYWGSEAIANLILL